jgi:hypothetical protein
VPGEERGQLAGGFGAICRSRIEQALEQVRRRFGK